MAGPLEKGAQIPSLELMDQDNEKVKLSEQVKKSKATILAFYLLDFTPG